MIIENNSTIIFKNLNVGDTFMFNGKFFMKTNTCGLEQAWCFNENNYNLEGITQGTVVQKVNAKIVVYD